MTMAITFDTLKFANRLKAAGVKPEIAEAHAEAEAEVFTETLINQVATKHDIIELKAELKSDINQLQSEMKELKNELIIKLGGITVAVGGLLGALIAIFHAT